MTAPPPPERQSVFAEPYRDGSWEANEPRQRRGRLWILPVTLVSVLTLVGIGTLGAAAGRAIGTGTPTITDRDGERINAIQVEPGMCIEALPGNGAVAQVTAIPCDVVHQAEAVAGFSVGGDEWPGRSEVLRATLDYCGTFIQPGFDATAMFQPTDWGAGLRWVAWIPTEESWRSGQQTGLCVVYRENGLQGSFVSGTASFPG